MERDFPKGHPAASDYAGEEYVPPRAPWAEDFAPNSPARGGKNTSALDTPDGMRKAHRAWEQSKREHEAPTEEKHESPS